MRSSRLSFGLEIGLREYAAVRLRDRVAYRVRAVKSGIQKSNMRHGRGFGHSVSLTDENVRERGEAAGKICVRGRGAGLYPSHRVVARKPSGFGRLAERVHRRRDERHHGNAVLP